MFNIPESKLPECLKNEDRLNVLFAPLRNRSVNSKDWEDKITTWKSIIKVYCESNNVYSFTLSSLNEVFVRNGRPPPCLSEVVADMIKNHEVEVMDVFLKKTADSWSGWLTDVVIKRPLSWSYNTVRKTIFSTTNSQYVHVEVVKKKSDELLAKVPSTYKDKVISLKELLSVVEDLGGINDLKLLLHCLEKDQQISVKALSNHNSSNEQDTLLIKIASNHLATTISDTEVAVYTLEQNEKLISKHVEQLEDEIEGCIENAKDQLRKKHKQSAKSFLVKKHQLEKQLEKKATALHNVQSCLEQLKGTHTNAHVWEAYKKALDAFNTTYKDTGLDEDAVEDTMLKLGEVLDINSDIETALARSPVGDDDTSLLEQELEELMKADKDEGRDQPPNDDSGVTDELANELDKLAVHLPEAPDSSPDVSLQAVGGK